MFPVSSVCLVARHFLVGLSRAERGSPPPAPLPFSEIEMGKESCGSGPKHAGTSPKNLVLIFGGGMEGEWHYMDFEIGSPSFSLCVP